MSIAGRSPAVYAAGSSAKDSVPFSRQLQDVRPGDPQLRVAE